MHACNDGIKQTFLHQNSDKKCIDYNIIGQERDGTFLLSWSVHNQTFFGINKLFEQAIQTVHQIDNRNAVVVVHATISQDASYLAYVTKDFCEQKCNHYYYWRIIDLSDDKTVLISKDESVSDGDCLDHSEYQTFVQFLYDRNHSSTEKRPAAYKNRFLLMRHNRYILLGSFSDKTTIRLKKIVNSFFWAQWEPLEQTLYYVHIRESNNLEYFYENSNPILSALQFHSALPHEHVLNITLNIPDFSKDTGTDIYEDDILPLRIHDTSLDLEILSNKIGMLFICHYYFFQETKKTINDDDNDDNNDDDRKLVKFAYSITSLHQNCIIHCTISDMEWHTIRNIKPTYKIHDHNFLLVLLPGLFIHLLDLGLRHEPCGHIITKINLTQHDFTDMRLAPIIGYGLEATLDLNTLNIINLTVDDKDLLDGFKKDPNVMNKLSIIHYLMCHRGQYDKVNELLSDLTKEFIHKDYVPILKEYLICSTFGFIENNLSNDAKVLINLLPMTTIPNKSSFEFYIENNLTLTVTQRTLRYTSMMLISPQQRLVPYMQDLWTYLWDNLTFSEKRKPRFPTSSVVDKLTLSLFCYQPEALSKCTTPISPAKMTTFNESFLKNNINDFPFDQIESCTANKQEHVLSANLRELSMYLLKYGSGNYGHKKFQWRVHTPSYIHSVALRYVHTVLDQSKTLLHLLCRFCSINLNVFWPEKGFSFINRIGKRNRNSLCMIFERYYLAIESLAYPLPVGFMPFYAYLSYRSLPFPVFLEYANRKVFDLQIDVLKLIINDDDAGCDINDKLQLLSIMPKIRTKRVLNQWNTFASILIRSKDYIISILEGSEGYGTKSCKKPSSALLVKTDHGTFIPALDSLLKMLTAKASLADLDFSLIVESVMAIKRNLDQNCASLPTHSNIVK